MTAEYTLAEGQEIGDLARELLSAAQELDRSPAVIAWAPRPDTPGGGVFVVTDVEVEQLVHQKRQAKAADEQAAAEAEGADEQPAEESGEDAETGDEQPAEGAPQTTAQKRKAAREAKAAAAADAATTEAPAEAGTEQNAE